MARQFTNSVLTMYAVVKGFVTDSDPVNVCKVLPDLSWSAKPRTVIFTEQYLSSEQQLTG
jgi:hypothetical protein